jgi:DNA topoisomerase I
MAAPTPTPEDALVWVSDSEPGLSRVREGSSFIYLDARGRPVRDARTLDRIRRLAIPPAYEQVWICARADGHLQATGRDARGRKQYRYHTNWMTERGKTKFDRMRRFARLLPAIRARVTRQLGQADEPTRERVLAALVRLLDSTALRIGNDEYARHNGSYGLTTLRTRHVGVNGAQVRLSFTGKSGVRHDVRLDDRRVARVMQRCRELPGQELFQYVDADGGVHKLGSADVNAWLADAAGAPVTAKDFRTWHGSVQALSLLLDACTRESDMTLTAWIGEVARRLGNTPAVCRKAYIHPAVLALGEAVSNQAARAALVRQRWVVSPPRLRGLSVAERQLMGLLAARARAPPTTKPRPEQRAPL